MCIQDSDILVANMDIQNVYENGETWDEGAGLLRSIILNFYFGIYFFMNGRCPHQFDYKNVDMILHKTTFLTQHHVLKVRNDLKRIC